MKYIVHRTRVVNEAISLDARNETEAVEKARKTKRKDWSHVESAKRSGYSARKAN